ncbi:T9SS type A sorting domain-containing protein [bacterium]|nr:T9SS type A sorting domain-containing protein [bacterium]
MYKRLMLILVAAVVIMIVFSRKPSAEPPTYYMHLTNFEVTNFDEIIWFWSYDTLYGPVHSNGFIGIKYSPHFYGPISTCQSRFEYYAPDPYFEYEPQFNAPPVWFLRHYPSDDLADLIIDDNDGRSITRVVLKGDEGIEIHQFPIGAPTPEPGEEDELIRRLNPPEWQVLKINGQCEVYGTLVGRLTISSSGDMYLIDNILYEGADPYTGEYDEEEMDHILGLASGGDIIIKDNEKNGANDGFNRYDEDDIDHHSITINGSLIAWDESFTFEHQNDDWEPYQGPEPDQRGIIHLKGSLAQWRRGYVHRSNHWATGYSKNYDYDQRLMEDAPPGFEPEYYPYVRGSYDVLELSHGPYTFIDVSVRKLIINAGVTIKIYDDDVLRVRDTLLIRGTEDEPVTITTYRDTFDIHIEMEPEQASLVSIRQARFSPNFNFWFDADRIDIERSSFGGDLYLNGRVNFCRNNCESEVVLTGQDYALVEENILRGGLSIDGEDLHVRIYNNTIVGNRGSGISAINFGILEAFNNIIAFNDKGIDNRNRQCAEPVLRYNDVYGNPDGNYLDCEPGEGSISADPLFLDFRSEDYRLIWGSPCIDAGDPAFPRDPDGSVIEMGAHYFDSELTVKSRPELISECRLDAMPNPFNRRTYLTFNSELPGLAHISIYDLQGRRIYEDFKYVETVSNRIVLDGRDLGGAGVYLARVTTAGSERAIKLVYLP